MSSLTQITPYRHYIPEEATLRAGCPAVMTPTYRNIAEANQKSRHEYAAMVLAHKTNDTVVNELRLGPLHHQLELDASRIAKSGASNILLSTLSFDCLIIDALKNELRSYITFDLRIPGIDLNKDVVFSYDTVAALYGKKSPLYRSLKHFYSLGKSTVNPEKHKHGHCPSYDPKTSQHDQYIRHTEQMLVAYLALPSAAQMICNRLRTQIRTQYADATLAKIFSMGLHMHSTKTCCAPCEYSLVGLMKEQKGIVQDALRISFLANFNDVCKVPNEALKLKPTTNPAFGLLVTVSVSEADADHRKQPDYTRDNKKSVEPYIISVKSAEVSRQIYTVMLSNNFTSEQQSTFSNLTDKTVAVSGSSATPGTKKTIAKVKKVREEEIQALEEMMHYLKLETTSSS